jgi:MFS family permease
MWTVLFFFVYGLGSGFFFGIDIAVFLVTLSIKFNEDIPLAPQIGHLICYLVLFIGGTMGMIIGPLLASFLVELVHSFSFLFQVSFFGGIITAFGTPIMIRSVPFVWFLHAMIFGKEVCHHIRPCECDSKQGATNRYIQDIYQTNSSSQFWNPIVVCQMALPGNFLGLIVALVYSFFK